jgi:hypothetical protein
MFVNVRLPFVLLVRLLVPVVDVILSVFMLMTMGVLMRMAVLDVSVRVLVVMHVGVLQLCVTNFRSILDSTAPLLRPSHSDRVNAYGGPVPDRSGNQRGSPGKIR